MIIPNLLFTHSRDSSSLIGDNNSPNLPGLHSSSKPFPISSAITQDNNEATIQGTMHRAPKQATSRSCPTTHETRDTLLQRRFLSGGLDRLGTFLHGTTKTSNLRHASVNTQTHIPAGQPRHSWVGRSGMGRPLPAPGRQLTTRIRLVSVLQWMFRD